MKRLCVCVAALGAVLGTSAASAADLGGDCCADLEERVAELEATTVRKGNRKVSLAITGWVAEQVMWYDNGATSNTYVTGVGSTLGSHFKLTGSAKISPDWSAGYVIQVEVNSSDPLTAGNSRFRDDGPSALHIVNSGGGLQSGSVDLLYSYWFLKSNRLGQVSVGLIPQASQHAAALVDGSGSLVMANWVPLDGMAINLSRRGTQFLVPGDPNMTGLPTGALMWCGSTALPIAGDCDGIPTNAVRYDSPTFGGFSISASWGEDDFWDVAARYAGEFNGIKVAITAAYSQHNDETQFTGFDVVTGLTAFHPVRLDSSYFQIGAYVQHVPSGLFLYGAYGVEDNNSTYADADITAGQPSGDNWYLKAGLRRKWNALGHTVLYGEYGVRNDMYHPSLTAFGVSGSELRQWGLGAVQEIDAAAMSLWVNYKNYDPSVSGPGVPGAFDDLDTLHVVTVGGLISF